MEYHIDSCRSGRSVVGCSHVLCVVNTYMSRHILNIAKQSADHHLHDMKQLEYYV